MAHMQQIKAAYREADRGGLGELSQVLLSTGGIEQDRGAHRNGSPASRASGIGKLGSWTSSSIHQFTEW